MKLLLAHYFHLTDVILPALAEELGYLHGVRWKISRYLNKPLSQPNRLTVTPDEMRGLIEFCTELTKDPVLLNEVMKS